MTTSCPARDPNTPASAAIWNWQSPAALPIDAAAARRRGAAIRAIVMCAVAALLTFGLHAPRLASVVCGFAVITVIGGFFAPPLYALLARLEHALTRIVTVFTTYLLLVPLFYVWFVPSRFFLGLRSRDPMQRRWEPDRASYWTDRKPIPGPHYYSRQF